MISNYAKLVSTFSKRWWRLGVSGNFNMSNYSHSDLVKNTRGKYENHLPVENISKTINKKSSFYFSGVDKADVEKSIGNLNSSKVEILKIFQQNVLKWLLIYATRFLLLSWIKSLSKIPTKIETWNIIDLLVFYLEYQRASIGAKTDKWIH